MATRTEAYNGSNLLFRCGDQGRSFEALSMPRLMRLCYKVTEGDAETDEDDVPIYVSATCERRSAGAENGERS